MLSLFLIWNITDLQNVSSLVFDYIHFPFCHYLLISLPIIEVNKVSLMYFTAVYH